MAKAPALRTLFLTIAALAVGSQTAAIGQDQPLDDAPFDLRLPDWAPAPPSDPANPLTAAKVELGRRLFFDGRLANDGMRSCASCHRQDHAFADELPLSWGVTGQLTSRNTPMLANLAYLSSYTWADPRVQSLESQALKPMFGQHPVEMGMAGQQEHLIGLLSEDGVYPDLFRLAYPEIDGEISIASITRAIAAFERTLISFGSPYDHYRYGGDDAAISESAKRGEALFFSDRLRCGSCHPAPHFTDAAKSVLAQDAYHNTGLYNIDGRGAYPPDDIGLAAVTGRPEDMGRFKTPSLRNVGVTAPYMHDGSIATLEDVLNHYAAGGRTIPTGEANAGIGSANPHKHAAISGFELSEADRRDLLAFLNTLTDDDFLTSSQFSRANEQVQ